ncbi:MAG: hypothetical protein HRT67_11875 [Flavobacteriaceae bacterium]|nr:hypothetical protein [Flavobacteriaceae bacterium]
MKKNFLFIISISAVITTIIGVIWHQKHKALLTNKYSFQKIHQARALEDFNEFKTILERKSSYVQVSNPEVYEHLEILEQTIKQHDSIEVHLFAYEFEKIIAETIDRHAYARHPDFNEDKIELLNLYFPYILAPFMDKALVLKKEPGLETYDYAFKAYPYLKQIHKMPLHDFIETYAYRRKNAPKASKLYDGLRDIRYIGELLYKNGHDAEIPIELVLTNGKKDTTFNINLVPEKQSWRNTATRAYSDISDKMYFGEPFEYERLSTWLKDSIAYINIPDMASYYDYTDLEAHITKTIDGFSTAQALIVDIRNNGGGTREILNTLSGYFVQPEQSPWVANITYVRQDEKSKPPIDGMNSRFLYTYNSDQFDEKDREAIDQFNKNYTSKTQFDTDKFSEPHYMILKNKRPFDVPVYILVNQNCFSAASVFTSVFKGLPNVKIAGVTTNGSSGRSHKFTLQHSKIKIKLSTMLSFQRNGKTLDGNGTQPDLIIPMDETHVLGKSDTQLEQLISHIKTQHATR